MDANSLLDTYKNDFETLCSSYMDYNSHTNISAIREKDDIYAKQFFDSLQSCNLISQVLEERGSVRLLDIGTGGGFPALPLSIVFREQGLSVTALDSVGKKTRFVEQMSRKLNLNDLQVLTGRAEDFAHDDEYRESFDVVVIRAVAHLSTALEYCIPFLKPGGFLFAYKSKNLEEELAESQSALKELSGELIAKNDYQVEGGDELRSILTILKSSKTNKKYPRLQGKAKKEPL